MKREKHRKACYYTRSLLQKCCSSKMLACPVEIVQLEDNSYHLIIKVEIDGIGGDMIIDTGASISVIDQKIFPEKQTDMAGIKMQSGSVTGQINDVRLIKADSFKIHGYKIRNLSLAGIDLDYVNRMYVQHLNRKIIGLLGCDFCVKYKAVIDYQKSELRLNVGNNLSGKSYS